MNYGEKDLLKRQKSVKGLQPEEGYFAPKDIDEERHPEEEVVDPEEFIKMNEDKKEGDPARTSQKPQTKNH